MILPNGTPQCDYCGGLIDVYHGEKVYYKRVLHEPYDDYCFMLDKTKTKYETRVMCDACYNSDLLGF